MNYIAKAQMLKNVENVADDLFNELKEYLEGKHCTLASSLLAEQSVLDLYPEFERYKNTTLRIRSVRNYPEMGVLVLLETLTGDLASQAHIYLHSIDLVE